MNFTNCLNFSWTLQDTSYLQKGPKLSLSCKNIARSLHFISSSRNIEIYLKISRTFDIYLLFARILQDMYCLRETFKTSINCKNFSRNLTICRNLARCLLFAGILQDNICKNFCKISLICKKFAKLTLSCKNLARLL